MSEGSVKSPDKNIHTARRSVARRACLSCREKKIKCDGEVVSRRDDENGGKKTIQNDPKVCTSCKFLGLECVFVQSMRGGRRKKRKDAEGKNAKLTKSDSNDEKPVQSTIKSTTTGSSFTERGTPPFSADPKVSKFGAPPAPTCYQMPFGEPTNRPRKSTRETSGEGYGRHYAYEYANYPPPIHPPPTHLHLYPPPPPPPPPPMMGYHMGAPGHSYYHGHYLTPPHPPPHLGEPHHHHRKHDWHHDGPHLPGHHHKKHHRFGPPHMMRHSPPHSPPHPPPHPPHKRRHWSDHPGTPSVMGHLYPPPPHNGSGLGMRAASSISSTSSISTLSSTISKNDSETRSRSGSFSGNGIVFQNPKEEYHSRHPPFIIPRLGGSQSGSYSPLYYSAHDAKDDSSTNTFDLSRSTLDASEMSYRSSPYEHEYEEPFDSYELNKYALPNWLVLNRLLDNYYKFNHSKHQLLPSKCDLIKRISLNSDSSILHAVISTVCSTDERMECERYWIEKVFQYWDNLNDFGMLLAYSLILKNSSVRLDLDKSSDLNSKMWELIKTNRLIDIINQPKEMLTSRQAYEREIMIRIIWSYWGDNVTVRFKQGFPKFQFLEETGNFELNDNFETYMGNLVLPLSDEENLKMRGKRQSYSVLKSVDFLKDGISDSSAVILATKRLEETISKISKNKLREDPGFGNELNNYINDKVLTINKENTLFIINLSFLLASFIVKTNDCLHSSFFIRSVIFSGLYESQAVHRLVPLADNISARSMFNFEELSKLINDFSEFQWQCLINLIISISDIMKLIEITSGLLPNEDLEHMVVIGVTCLDRIGDRHWWDNSELITDQQDSWYKYPDFALYSACSLVSMLVSLLILTKFIKFSKQDSVLNIELLHSKSKRELNLPRNHQFIGEFNVGNILQKLSTLISFIKFKLQSNNENIELIADITEKLDKICLSVEETLAAIP